MEYASWSRTSTLLQLEKADIYDWLIKRNIYYLLQKQGQNYYHGIRRNILFCITETSVNRQFTQFKVENKNEVVRLITKELGVITTLKLKCCKSIRVGLVRVKNVHEVICLPLTHAEYTPIEMVQVKEDGPNRNKTFKFAYVETTFSEVIDKLLYKIGGNDQTEQCTRDDKLEPVIDEMDNSEDFNLHFNMHT